MADLNTPTTPFLSIILRKHASFINEKVRKYNLSVGTCPILIAIYKNNGIIQEELANLLHLNESTITRGINKLENNGFIEKNIDEENKRRNYIEITPKGKQVSVEIMDFEDQWDEYCCQKLSKNEFITYKSILIKIVNTITD